MINWSSLNITSSN